MKSTENQSEQCWPRFRLIEKLRSTKNRKKVPVIEQFRNHATLDALAAGVRSSHPILTAGFSINTVSSHSVIDSLLNTTDLSNRVDRLVQSLPSLIQIDPELLENTRCNQALYNKPPTWKYARQNLKAAFYQLAMLKDADRQGMILTPFSLNLTPEFVSKALSHRNGFLDYTKRRIDKALQIELGRAPQYWFVVEITPASGSHSRGHQRPHIHGSILLNPSERVPARKQITRISKAFNAAIGNCSSEFKNRLIELGNHKRYAESKDISELEAVLNWSRYCFKHHAYSRLFLDSNSNLTADNTTKKQAKELYGLISI